MVTGGVLGQVSAKDLKYRKYHFGRKLMLIEELLSVGEKQENAPRPILVPSPNVPSIWMG